MDENHRTESRSKVPAFGFSGIPSSCTISENILAVSDVHIKGTTLYSILLKRDKGASLVLAPYTVLSVPSIHSEV